MENYVTLFNKLFIPQGLALHKSMERYLKNYILWILCIDNETYNVLRKLKLPNVHLLQLSTFETKELLNVKAERSIGEYCWTLTPFVFSFVFKSDQSVKRVTYIDSDLYFLKSPQPLFNEFDLSKKKVLITEHAYAPDYDQSEKFGKFCVQFLIISREGGETVRKWWEERCIEWCFARLEDGKFGDQKYLDDWPDRFKSLVHVLQEKEFALAPWNAIKFPFENAIFYHFHSLRIISKKKLQIGSYLLPEKIKKNIYIPYCKDLKLAISLLDSIQFTCQPQASVPNILRRIYRKFRQIRSISNILVPSNYMKW